ncbi:MAG: hypothetical protein LBF58_02615 [Deltaproteobacteria bacterium]|nr:hypothetical protein [Deltaproteobacteria bacterium]
MPDSPRLLKQGLPRAASGTTNPAARATDRAISGDQTMARVSAASRATIAAYIIMFARATGTAKDGPTDVPRDGEVRAKAKASI